MNKYLLIKMMKVLAFIIGILGTIIALAFLIINITSLSDMPLNVYDIGMNSSFDRYFIAIMNTAAILLSTLSEAFILYSLALIIEKSDVLIKSRRELVSAYILGYSSDNPQ